MKRYYSHTKTVTMPAGYRNGVAVDGIYINDDLWQNYTPLIDAVATISVTPDGWKVVGHGIVLFFPSFNNGVFKRLSVNFSWLPFESGMRQKTLAFNGHPYGIGLNLITLYPFTDPLPSPYAIAYSISYQLEVDT
jgi:hypothetical protein